MPRVSVIIPTWNRKDLALACLRSLQEQQYRDFETVVVDDGSTDGTADAVREAYPGVRVLRNAKNCGFCVAVNSGIREAQGELVVLLNNDMTLEPDFLGRLVEAADRSEAAMFAPLVLMQDDPEMIYSAGDRQRANGRPESIGFRCKLAGFAFSEAIFGVSGGAALYRKELFDKIGLFDEHFIAYFEDSDFNFRARLAGYKAELVREAVAHHVGAASIEGRTWWRNRQCCRNHALLLLKNMPLSLLLRHAPAIVAERAHQARQVLSAARTEFGLARAVGVLLGTLVSIFGQIPHVLTERRRIQGNRMLPPAELAKLLMR